MDDQSDNKPATGNEAFAVKPMTERELQARLLLPGGSDEQRALFEEALALVPKEIISILINEGVHFETVMRKGIAGTPFGFRDPATIQLDSRDFLPSATKRLAYVRSMAVSISTGLAQILHPVISDDMLKRCARDKFIAEHKKKNSVEVAPREQTYEQLQEERAHRIRQRAIYAQADHLPLLDTKQRIAIAILNGFDNTLPQSQDPEEGPTLDPIEIAIEDAEKEVYDLHLKAAEERQATRHIWAKHYIPTDKAFAINEEGGALTSYQRQYFEHLNKLLELLGASPDEFNKMFETTVAEQIVQLTSYAVLTAEFTKNVKAKITRFSKSCIDESSILHHPHIIGTSCWFVPIMSGKITDQSYERLSFAKDSSSMTMFEQGLTHATEETVKNTSAALSAIIANRWRTRDRRSNHMSPFFSVFDISKSMFKDCDADFIMTHKPSNFLQTMAAGLVPFHRFNLSSQPIRLENFQAIPPCTMELIHAGILNAVQALADEKKVPKEKVHDIIKEMKELHKLQPKLFMTVQQEQEEKRKFEIEEKARAERQATKQKKSNEETIQRAEQAKINAEKEAKRYAEFMAKPQPYVLDRQSQAILSTLSNLATVTSPIAHTADFLAKTIIDAMQSLDIRDGNVKELGDVILSPGNLLAMAKAAGLENQLAHIKAPARPALNNLTEKLRRLSMVSPKVGETINAMLENENAVMLLASLTRQPERCKNYATFINDIHRKQHGFDTRIEATLTQLRGAGFSDDDLALLADAPEVKALNNLRSELDKVKSEIQAPRADLVQEIRQAFQGKTNIKKIAAGAAPTVTQVKTELELSKAWKEALGEEFHAEESPDGAKFIQIASNEFPYKFVTMRHDAGDGALQKNLTKLRADCAMHKTNLDLLQKLGASLGFQIESKDNKYQLLHREYGMAVALEGEEAAQTTALINAEARFQEREFQQQALLYTAKEAGIVIAGVDENLHATGAITLSHAAFGSVTLAPRGYLSADDFTTVQSLINKTRGEEPTPETATVDLEVAPPTEAAWKPWQPEPGTTMMVFDTNTLQKLTAQRGQNGHTWLDLVKCTGRLPNAKVIIPSVIADLEMQGQIPVYDEHGLRTGVVRVDPRYEEHSGHYLSHIGKSTKQWLTSASYASIGADGTVHIKEGANKNIIVMETPGDRVLYDKIRVIMASPPGERQDLLNKEIYHHDEGEESINRIVQQLPFDAHFMIISDDKKYLGGMNGVSAPLTSGRGKPVGQTGTGCYLDAEIRYREPSLRKMLGEDEPLSIYRLGESINAFWTEKCPEDYVYLNRHSKRGEYDNGVKGDADHIYSLVEKGVSAAKKATTEAHSNEKTWAGNGPGAAIVSNPISPGAIRTAAAEASKEAIGIK